MNRPMFSILLPAKGRPNLVSDALVSILQQSYTNFEVIVSNNGGDPTVREALQPFISDARVRYFEQPTLLPMPKHWECLSLLATGRYQIVVPDRSLLCQNALTSIFAAHQAGGIGTDIVSWSWDLFHSKTNVLQPVGSRTGETVVLMSEQTVLDSLHGTSSHPLSLPRGLNSSVSTELILEIRRTTGQAFTTLNPDFSFAYSCLLMREKFSHICQPLSISQGLDVSNGGNAFRTDASDYLATLGIERPIHYSPISAPFVENTIAEDFFAACYRFGRSDLVARFDRATLYLKCKEELKIKRAARILTHVELENLANSIDRGLSTEDPFIRDRVAKSQITRDRGRTAKNFLKRLLGERSELVRPYVLRLRGGRRFASALQAAGHDFR